MFGQLDAQVVKGVQLWLTGKLVDMFACLIFFQF